MTDERNATASISEDELAGLSAEALPDREAMSLICPPGDEMGAAIIPPDDSGQMPPEQSSDSAEMEARSAGEIPPPEETQPGPTAADS